MTIAQTIDLAGLKATDPAVCPVVFRSDVAGEPYCFAAGDFTSKIAADADGAIHVKADSVAANMGAYVKKFYGPAQFHWFKPPRDNTGDASPHLRRAMANEDVIEFSDKLAQYRLADPIFWTRNGQKLKGPGRKYPTLRFAVTSGKCIYNSFFGTTTMLENCGISDLYIEAASLGSGSVVAPQNMVWFTFERNWIYGPTVANTRLLDLTGNYPQGFYYGEIHQNYFSYGQHQIYFGAGANGNRYGGNRFQPFIAGGVATAIVMDCAAANQICGNVGLGNLIEMPNHVSDGMYIGKGVNGLTIGPMYYEGLRRSILVSGDAVNVVRAGHHIEDGCSMTPVGLPSA